MGVWSYPCAQYGTRSPEGQKGGNQLRWGGENNPGRAGCAATLSTWEIPHAQVAADSEFVGIQTNNVAEYAGMILLLWLAQAHGLTRVEVRGDSRLVINQMAHGWACRKLSLISMQGITRRLMASFEDGVAFKWVAREQL
jgi:ribonuclease HI